MNISTKKIIGISILSIMGTATAYAAPSEDPVTGHFYEVFSGNGITWDQANADAKARSFNGIPGHLATITSSSEDTFVEFLRAQAIQTGVISRNEVWIGGFQPESNPVGEGWVWENMEGAISTPQAPLSSYSNWLANEPNDNTGAGSENHLAVGLGGQFGWNDEGALGNIGGYVVEYDTPIAASDCASSAGGCETIPGHELAFPDDSIPAGANIEVNSFEFDDDQARCGISPLVLFDADEDPNDEMPELIIPAYLCGSPKLVVISVDSSELNILDGTVSVENDTETVLPGNEFVCEDPIVQNFPTQGDPQDQDVVVWQSTDPNRMLEIDPGVGGVGQFAGAAGEFTDNCGSSRGRVRGASYYVIGAHIDFGPGFEWASNTAGNFDSFVALTRYKLTLLQESVNQAFTDGAIDAISYRVLRILARSAIIRLDRGEYSLVQLYIDLFLSRVNLVNYVNVAGENYNGEHIMRASNIEFTLRVKVIPYAPQN